ncbi:hypothetical protein OWV82_016815 [Melia azedarach]|uniref:Uncharacterized protein n=1 Tax=Melia azedarach TaxID=155640 RepID=A0ACC1XH89_MELAZ|nr:hypothetical protein OWV82_016815 [Melia azedarach]
MGEKLPGTCLTLYHRFLSAIQSFFNTTSGDIHIQEVHDVNPSTTEPPSSPNPASSVCITVFDVAPQMLLDSNPKSSNSSPENESPTLQDQNSEQTVVLHPVIWNFRNQELGRHLLVLAIPMIIALSTSYNPKNVPTSTIGTAVALSLGVALIWNGILLRKTWPNLSNWIELLGAAFMLLCFYRYVSCFLPKTLIWIPALCWLLNLIPFAVAYFSRERVLENGDTIQTSTEFPL